MSFLPHLPAPIHEFADGVKTALSSFFHKALEQTDGLRARIQQIAGKLADRLPPGKRRPVLIASIGVCAVFALIFVGTSLARGGHEGRKPPAAGTAPVRQGLIPSDDLFLPEEPDFVPGVLLEREQRVKWTADDAVPLWQDPLKNGEEPWRNRIEKAIDEIMESVP
jgi:hypothetical protein